MTELEPLGDTAWRIRLNAESDPAAVLACLRKHPNVVDAVVADGFALVRFAPGLPPSDPRAVLAGIPPVSIERRQRHIVHVRYDGADLQEMAGVTGLSVQDLICEHTGRDYSVEAIGFLPGFAYLGPVSPTLKVPRRKSPRLRVPAGAVAIAAGRTAVYPFASPGGWNLIGTAIDFTPFAFQLGDRVRFEAVS